MKKFNVKKVFLAPNIDAWREKVATQEKMGIKVIDEIISAYQTAKKYKGRVSKLALAENGRVLLPKTALIHLTTVINGSQRRVIDYDKLHFIQKYGLVCKGALTAEHHDDKVSMQVEFYRCDEPITVDEKLKQAGKFSNSDIGIIVDVNNLGMQKLLEFDKTYSSEIELKTGKIYIPIGVPSQYVFGLVLSKELENNQYLRNYLNDKFENAILISSDGRVIGREQEFDR